MPIEYVICPEMLKLATEHNFKFFKTWDDEKDYTKELDDGTIFSDQSMITIDKLP